MTEPDDDFECPHLDYVTTFRSGIVTSGGLGADRGHAAVDVCSDSACVERAMEWASRVTGESARFISERTRE